MNLKAKKSLGQNCLFDKKVFYIIQHTNFLVNNPIKHDLYFTQTLQTHSMPPIDHILILSSMAVLLME